MPAIGFGLAWAGWTLGLWGFCLVKGYDITLGELVNPAHVLNWQQATGQHVPVGQILPSGTGPKKPPAQAV
jgi:hypothetical protein